MSGENIESTVEVEYRPKACSNLKLDIELDVDGDVFDVTPFEINLYLPKSICQEKIHFLGQ